MILNLLSDLTTTALTRSLDACGLRHRVISNNIANVETPGFNRCEVSFESRLRQVLDSGSKGSVVKRVQEIQPEAQLDRVSPARPDGNNVSVDREMADLVKNTLKYEAFIQLLNKKGSMVRAAITEGRR